MPRTEFITEPRKFKVGDRVRVRTDLPDAEWQRYALYTTRAHAGLEYDIVLVDAHDSTIPYRLSHAGWYPEHFLESACKNVELRRQLEAYREEEEVIIHA